MVIPEYQGQKIGTKIMNALLTKIDEYKKDIRESEALIIGIIIVCLVISFITDITMAKYIFISVSAMMFIFCTIYTFANERRIIARQNKYSETALLESISHIRDEFTYEKDEKVSGTYYGKAGDRGTRACRRDPQKDVRIRRYSAAGRSCDSACAA